MADTFASKIQAIHDSCSRHELNGVSLFHFTDPLLKETTVRTMYFGTGYGSRNNEDLDLPPQQVFIELPHARRKHFSYKGHRVLYTSTNAGVHAQRIFTFKNDDLDGWKNEIKREYKPEVAEKIFNVVHIVKEVNDVISASGSTRDKTWTSFHDAYKSYAADVAETLFSGQKRYLTMDTFCVDDYFNHSDGI